MSLLVGCVRTPNVGEADISIFLSTFLFLPLHICIRLFGLNACNKMGNNLVNRLIFEKDATMMAMFSCLLDMKLNVGTIET